MLIEIRDPMRLLVEAASFLALQVPQPDFSQAFEGYTSNESFSKAVKILISQDTS
jgi:hypothetical protein